MYEPLAVRDIVPSQSYCKDGKLTFHWVVLKWHSRPRVALQFKWYDLWVGAYYDQPNHTWYICPLPCVVLKVYPKAMR